jgi:hypothetical protein
MAIVAHMVSARQSAKKRVDFFMESLFPFFVSGAGAGIIDLLWHRPCGTASLRRKKLKSYSLFMIETTDARRQGGYALRFSEPKFLPMRFYKTAILLHLFQQYAWESLAVMEKGNDMKNIRRESLLIKPPSPEPLYEKRKVKRT